MFADRYVVCRCKQTSVSANQELKTSKKERFAFPLQK